MELTKCFWVPIVWKWKGGKPYIPTKNNSRNKDLTLIELETKEKIIIPQKSCKEKEKRLGVWTNCDSSWAAEYKYWIDFSRQFEKK